CVGGDCSFAFKNTRLVAAEYKRVGSPPPPPPATPPPHQLEPALEGGKWHLEVRYPARSHLACEHADVGPGGGDGLRPVGISEHLLESRQVQDGRRHHDDAEQVAVSAREFECVGAAERYAGDHNPATTLSEGGECLLGGPQPVLRAGRVQVLDACPMSGDARH